jgi:hypothetical protein
VYPSTQGLTHRGRSGDRPYKDCAYPSTQGGKPCGRSGDRPYRDCAYPSTQGAGFAIILLFTFYFLLARPARRGWQQKNRAVGPVLFMRVWCLLFEVAVEETFEAFAVTSFVFSHFVNGVVNGVEACSFSVASDAHFVFASA